jgi:toxin ParE1/3/4
VRLELKASARADLQDIYDFSLDEFGLEVAEAYLAGLRRVFDRLIEFPHSAPVYAGVKPEMRVKTYRRHRVFYKVDGDAVLIAECSMGDGMSAGSCDSCCE